MVLTEFLNHYSILGPLFRRKAVLVVSNLQQDSTVEIIPQSDYQFEQALNFYNQRQDKKWSLVDCASFLIMQERGIIEALAYDIHFRQAGFVPLLRDD